jgi:energy-coupling factor transporter ATP-binding protein EcfA2
MLLDSMAVATHAAEHDAVLPAVVFDHVSFAFDDHVVLRDVSSTIPTGGMTMLLGASGSGKSVLEQVTSIVVTHQIRDAFRAAGYSEQEVEEVLRGRGEDLRARRSDRAT